MNVHLSAIREVLWDFGPWVRVNHHAMSEILLALPPLTQEERQREENSIVEMENVFRMLQLQQRPPGLVRFVSACSVALTLVPLVLLGLVVEDAYSAVNLAILGGIAFSASDAFHNAINLITGLPILFSAESWMPKGAVLFAVVVRAAWYIFVLVLFGRHDLGGHASIGLGMMVLRSFFGVLFLATMARSYLSLVR